MNFFAILVCVALLIMAKGFGLLFGMAEKKAMEERTRKK